MSTTPGAVCDTNSAGPQSRYAAEWGLASLILAGFMTLMAVLMFMLLIGYLILIQAVRPSRFDVQLAVGITSALTALCCAVAFVGIVAGWIGVRAAWARCQPGGLPVVGLVLSLLAFLLWLSVAVALVGNIIDFSRRNLI